MIERDAPVLRDLVLLDCPDPDTTEDEASRGTNLAKLRELLPHCDVLLVATTQQKYRSARVADELASAAAGARLVFVQTHADVDSDVREDWQRSLAGDYATGEMFFVDSLAAVAEARQGMQPRGEFGRLVDLLTRELTVAATHRIRRANFLDLVGESLAICQASCRRGHVRISNRSKRPIQEQRARLAARLTEAIARRVVSQSTKLGKPPRRRSHVAVGLQPLLLRVKTLPGDWRAGRGRRAGARAQCRAIGPVGGGRRRAAVARPPATSTGDAATVRAAALGWEEADLRTAAIIIDGYAAEAGLDRRELEPAPMQREAAGRRRQLYRRCVGPVANRHPPPGRPAFGPGSRGYGYEFLFSIVFVALLYRFARNFFYDSWLGPELGLSATAQPVLGTDFFFGAGCAHGLERPAVWFFTSRLRRGLTAEINEVARPGAAPSSRPASLPM